MYKATQKNNIKMLAELVFVVVGLGLLLLVPLLYTRHSPPSGSSPVVESYSAAHKQVLLAGP